MSGISSKAAGSLTNKLRYNGIEQNNDFDLNMYDAFYRNLDPQIGRFWQVDPQLKFFKSSSPYECMGNDPINNVDPLGDFRNRVGAWLHKVFNGGGTIGKNEFGEYYVSKTSSSSSEDGGVTVTASFSYGKGRDKYSNLREKISDENQQDEARNSLIQDGIFDPNMSAEDARFSGLRLGTNLMLPYAVIKPVTIASNSLKVKTGTTVLGHYPEYKNLADAIGARRFNIPTDIWNKMGSIEQWAANQKFLDRMIARGDNIRLATSLDKVKPGSFFEKELNYLFSQGYKVGKDGLSLVK